MSTTIFIHRFFLIVSNLRYCGLLPCKASPINSPQVPNCWSERSIFHWQWHYIVHLIASLPTCCKTQVTALASLASSVISYLNNDEVEEWHMYIAGTWHRLSLAMHIPSLLKRLIGFPLRLIAALWRLVFKRRPPNRVTDEEALISPSSSSCRVSTEQEQDKMGSSPSMLTVPSLSIEHGSDNGNVVSTTSSPSVSKKKALLIGIRYGDSAGVPESSSGDGPLKGPHVEVLKMRQLLLGKRLSFSYVILNLFIYLPDCYDYSPDDITVLVDDYDPEHTQPTEENIVSTVALFMCLNSWAFFLQRYKVWKIS